MEFYELLSFGRQLGLALMGAASLWGMVFLYVAHNKKLTDTAGVFLSWIGLRLRWLIIAGGGLAVLMWLIPMLMPVVHAHEGVTLITRKGEVMAAMRLMSPLYIGIGAIVLLLLAKFRRPDFLYNPKTGFAPLYVLSFILSAVAISYYTDLRGLPVNETIFHIFHGFHSIFTLGTVICLDMIFLSTQNAPFVQKHVFPLFPQISKVIWVGLSLDLFSTLLIYPEAIALTPRFYFAQLVVGILILNGILLSGVITRRMLHNIAEGHGENVNFWEKVSTIAGAISITSWMAITFVDQFHSMTIPLGVLFAAYGVVIVAIIIGHELWNKFDTRAQEFTHAHIID